MEAEIANESSSPTDRENKESLKKIKTPANDKSQKMVYQKKQGEATKDAAGTFQVKQGAKTLVYKKKDKNEESPVADT